MAATIPAKSILKQHTTTPKPTLSDEEKAKAERDRRNLGLALYHANKIQSQKDVQATILSHTEKLLDLPTSHTFTPTEASSFASLIAIFQPSDFDSLVEERRIDGKCGYALCANVPRSSTLGSSAVWKLKGKAAGDFCSNDCLQKALYVKAQLSEVPAWEREPGQQPAIVLPEHDEVHMEQPQHRRYGGLDRRSVNDSELAAERGEKAGAFRPNQVMLDTIVEKRTIPSKPRGVMKAIDTTHDSIEGYVPPRKGDVAQSAEGTTARKSFVNSSEVSATANQLRQKDEEEESWEALYENLSIR